uniref:Uncharacterized protein n=1 Tax=Bactrocera latifrons TaxID=174628 RepID=A0A0K8ULA3_BACLA
MALCPAAQTISDCGWTGVFWNDTALKIYKKILYIINYSFYEVETSSDLLHCSGDTVVKSIMADVSTMPCNDAMPCMSVPVSNQLIFTRSAICSEHNLLILSLKDRSWVR